MGSDLKRQLRVLIDQYGGTRGTRMHNLYHNVLPRVVDLLYEKGYKIRYPDGLREKHLAVIANTLIGQGLPPQTLDMVWLAVKSWAKWVGKGDMVGSLEKYIVAAEPDASKLRVGMAISIVQRTRLD